MSGFQVLLVAGTHGNEINPPWLFDQWDNHSDLINTYGINFSKTIGNPKALSSISRYIDQDLNRSFTHEFLEFSESSAYEIKRARELLRIYGPNGSNPSQIAIDFHTTTSSMGSSIVLYGRRPSDLALASLLQYRLGLPIYLHESEDSQKGFLVECWPCGLVIEIGPVAQALLDEEIITKIKISLEICLEEIAKINSELYRFPKRIIVHRHLKSLDYPRDLNGNIIGLIKSNIKGRDWLPIEQGEEIFTLSNGDKFVLSDRDLPNSIVPVFINEAAYSEKNISMSFTSREVWSFNKEWQKDFISLINQ